MDAPDDRPERRLLLFLHPLGSTPQTWQDQVTALPDGWGAAAPWLRGLKPTDDVAFAPREAAAALGTELVRQGARSASLCGVAAGALVAMQFAVDNPGQVHRLVLVDGQLQPPRSVQWLQRTLIKRASARRLAEAGLDRDRMLQAMDALAQADAGARLGEIAVPTLVVSGDRDRATLAASRLLATRIAGAELVTLAGVGREPHREAPAAFNEAVYDFLTDAQPAGQATVEPTETTSGSPTRPPAEPGPEENPPD